MNEGCETLLCITGSIFALPLFVLFFNCSFSLLVCSAVPQALPVALSLVQSFLQVCVAHLQYTTSDFFLPREQCAHIPLWLPWDRTPLHRDHHLAIYLEQNDPGCYLLETITSFVNVGERRRRVLLVWPQQ
jgi:hypothetical protein